MPRITVDVESTIGSSIGRHDGPGAGIRDAPSRAGGWPVGEGSVEDTLDTEGRSVRTMVLMQEPARPGDEVNAWPVAVLHLSDGRHDLDEVVCVAEAEPFVDLVDTTDLGRRHAEPAAWAAALGRLSPGTAYRVTGCGSRREADRLVADARHTYLQLTGCME
ncbi:MULTISPECIES: inorganic diphosphatase [unclassified Streptomyces]|uniref:inorganic diphosphatase n=1 Tax=unclassified Streptomyces TaxID=2593676 RepID=UPI002E794273|nr:inorganic diphosphatase [Streptomyces sp. JV184]MEE1748409.1 inorganic diphosphatase [Streptomyces sp. JV184]MEE1748468.1 inorganic diphosphatase [Streptomyces sp. JV184]